MAVFPVPLITAFLSLVVLLFVISANAEGYHGPATHHPFFRRNSTAISSANLTLAEAQDIVASFQAAMAKANAARREKPSRNEYTVKDKAEIQDAVKPAPYLEYDTSNSTLTKLRRRHWRRQFSNNATDAIPAPSNSTESISYTIPPEVVEAARLLAEAEPPDASSAGYEAVVADMKAQFGLKNNDTNVMAQKMQEPSGLLEYVGNVSAASYIVSSNSTAPEPLVKRVAAADFWMQKIAQRGASPFAPAGYKVWRNVKDYGAKGDGITDDTAAIQRAMSEGGRCGANCGGSTIFPATVYFPPGTYIISSSIIMYYNTEMLGNPIELPKLVASSSFVGGGLIESNVYTGVDTTWYLNANNFLRSVRNFIIDIRAGSQTARICGIHWQVAQGTSLENIQFFMTDPAVNPATTQQGLYMENGSGGFMSDLYFVGGKYGAFMGNQQYTSSGLYFSKADTALQVHWDWGWTMQNIVIDQCNTGVSIVMGVNNPGSSNQTVGSMTLTDMLVSNTPFGIKASLFDANFDYITNLTSLLILNSKFTNVSVIALDATKSPPLPLMAGDSGVTTIPSWGFGTITAADGTTRFFSPGRLPAMTRPASLIQPGSPGTPQAMFFTRRRPSYADLGQSQLLDVKELGAKGDGVTDDTAVLNHVLDVAANISAVVYFPYGVYMVSDTIKVPVGSRIIGHVWPQIMGYGASFSTALTPRAVVQVGAEGSVGSVEIQNILFTVKGGTAGAILVQWNVHQSIQGSAGLWDSHFRVGGAKGSDLDPTKCPKSGASVRVPCVAASLLMHITSKASAYLENVWAWTADHYIDVPEQTQIDIYSARGMLIESQGPTWLWGTSVEHSVMYQYQLSKAKNVLIGLAQAESPYFQPVPKAPLPFSPGAFADDPVFTSCGTSAPCAYAWGLRILDSQSVYVLTAGLYSFFNSYSTTCSAVSSTAGCQTKIFHAEQTKDLWVYNLITIGATEMASPVGGNATLAALNRNGVASSLLAWLVGSTQQVGTREFEGYALYGPDDFAYSNLTAACKTALRAVIKCDNYTRTWTAPTFHGDLANITLTNSVCSPSCAQSLAAWQGGVGTFCAGQKFPDGSPPAILGNYIWYGVNETCQKDSNGAYCGPIIASFPPSKGLASMPTTQLCSACYLGRLRMMQASRYSAFAAVDFFRDALALANQKCLVNVPTTTQPALFPPTAMPTPFCVSNTFYTAVAGDTCDKIALAKNVSSVDLYNGNYNVIRNCSAVAVGSRLCLPLQCSTYRLTSSDTCGTASIAAGVADIARFNPWINVWCDNLHAESVVGSVLCASPPGGPFNKAPPSNATSNFPHSSTGYGKTRVFPPKTPANGTNPSLCGVWYVPVAGDTCDKALIQNGINMELFVAANPSVRVATCNTDLVPGKAYCVAPLRIFNVPFVNLGCYARSDGGLVLGDVTRTYTTPDWFDCGAFCLLDRGYPAFGMVNGTTCVCDERLNAGSARVADTVCKATCPNAGWCGGPSSYSVFSLDPNLPTRQAI